MKRESYEQRRRANLVLAQAREAHYSNAEIVQLAAAADSVVAASPPSDRERSNRDLRGPGTTGIEATATLRMRQIPTSFVHLLDESSAPLVTFQVKNCRDRKARLRLKSRVEGFSTDAIATLELEPRAEVKVPQLPVFHLDRIAAVTEARTACVYVQVTDLDGRLEHEQTHRAVLLPRTTAYLSVEDAAGGAIDLTPYLAAWVTPNAAEVMALVREAAALTACGTIVGYQAAHPEELPAVVEAQIDAIYRALQARAVTYVNSVCAFNLAGEAFAQRIRLPRETLAMGSANCIDGTVLMASILEAASLNPGIVLVPGHAFLAYEKIGYSGKWDYVETTLLGSAPFAEAQRAGREAAECFRGRLKILSIPKLRIEQAIFPME